MRAKLLVSDSNENGESMDDFEEYRPSTPLATQNGTKPSIIRLNISPCFKFCPVNYSQK